VELPEGAGELALRGLAEDIPPLELAEEPAAEPTLVGFPPLDKLPEAAVPPEAPRPPGPDPPFEEAPHVGQEMHEPQWLQIEDPP
jgi:hypothetical protein